MAHFDPLTGQYVGDDISFASTSTIETTYFTLMICGKDGHMIVGIKPDGQIDYGPGYDPDEAAKAFWQAMVRNQPLNRIVLSSMPYVDPDKVFWDNDRDTT